MADRSVTDTDDNLKSLIKVLRILECFSTTDRALCDGANTQMYVYATTELRKRSGTVTAVNVNGQPLAWSQHLALSEAVPRLQLLDTDVKLPGDCVQ